MNILHHVKKHWKTITLHLKKHHKKYIFWILSATLLRKWVSLIAAYALVHNLSFSFADIIHNGWDDNQQTEITIEQATAVETPTDETPVVETPADETPAVETPDVETPADETPDDETTTDKTPVYETPTDETPNNETPDNEQDTNNEEELNYWNWFCDAWDILIKSPIAWDITWKEFDITREFINSDCQNNSYTIKLRDQNDHYLDIFSWNYNITWFKFDSTQLMSWFYNETWINESWEIIILHEWTYSWNATNYFTWHKIAIVSDEWITIHRDWEWWEFTIDNKKPEISNIKIDYSTNNKKLNIGDTITISFESDEELIDTTVNVLWQSALLEDKDWNKYTYTMDFSDKNTEWKIVYWIEYSDIIWNTWYYEWYENIELDYKKPIIDRFNFEYKWKNEIKLTFTTDEITNVHFTYVLSWSKKTDSTENSGKAHEFTIQNTIENYSYNYSISIEDEARNTLNIWWTFMITWNNVIFTNKEINKSELITEIGFHKILDENQSIKDLKQKLNSFSSCSEGIEFVDLNLPIKWKTAKVKMPKFEDKNINKITNAFTVELFKRIEGKNLPQETLNTITEDLNNFLIIVKLVKEDNNSCKQNMTHYYVNKFRKTLIKYELINN